MAPTIKHLGSTTRVELTLDDNHTALLHEMARTCDCTLEELFNDALLVFGWTIAETTAGRNVASIDKAAQAYKEIETPLIKKLKEKRANG